MVARRRQSQPLGIVNPSMKTQSRDVASPANARLRYSLATLLTFMTICCIAAAVVNVLGAAVLTLVFPAIGLIALLVPTIFLCQWNAKFVQFGSMLFWLVFFLMVVLFLICVAKIALF